MEPARLIANTVILVAVLRIRNPQLEGIDLRK
jgi:hypothetical protein